MKLMTLQKTQIFPMEYQYIPLEILIFVVPPSLPAVLYHSHIMNAWIYNIMANWIGFYIHSGYEFPIINKIFFLESRDHDIHHVVRKYNYSTGMFYSFMDRIFGTYLRIKK